MIVMKPAGSRSDKTTVTSANSTSTMIGILNEEKVKQVLLHTLTHRDILALKSTCAQINSQFSCTSVWSIVSDKVQEDHHAKKLLTNLLDNPEFIAHAFRTTTALDKLISHQHINNLKLTDVLSKVLLCEDNFTYLFPDSASLATYFMNQNQQTQAILTNIITQHEKLMFACIHLFSSVWGFIFFAQQCSINRNKALASNILITLLNSDTYLTQLLDQESPATLQDTLEATRQLKQEFRDLSALIDARIKVCMPKQRMLAEVQPEMDEGKEKEQEIEVEQTIDEITYVAPKIDYDKSDWNTVFSKPLIPLTTKEPNSLAKLISSVPISTQEDFLHVLDYANNALLRLELTLTTSNNPDIPFERIFREIKDNIDKVLPKINAYLTTLSNADHINPSLKQLSALHKTLQLLISHEPDTQAGKLQNKQLRLWLIQTQESINMVRAIPSEHLAAGTRNSIHK